MKVIVLVLLGAFVATVLWIALVNSGQVVEIGTGLGASRQMSLGVVIVGAVLSGMLIAGLVALADGLAQRLQNRRLSRRIDQLEREIHELRGIAIDETPAADEPLEQDEP